MKIDEIETPEIAKPVRTQYSELLARAKESMTPGQFKKWKHLAAKAIFHGKMDGKAARKKKLRSK